VGGGLTCGTRMQISVRELTGSRSSEYVCEGAGHMRLHTTRSESVFVCKTREMGLTLAASGLDGRQTSR
jgi:hypothetical protein